MKKQDAPSLRVLLRVTYAAQGDDVAVPVSEARVPACSAAFDVSGVRGGRCTASGTWEPSGVFSEGAEVPLSALGRALGVARAKSARSLQWRASPKWPAALHVRCTPPMLALFCRFPMSFAVPPCRLEAGKRPSLVHWHQRAEVFFADRLVATKATGLHA